LTGSCADSERLLWLALAVWRCGGGQFGRFACGCTPACGSKVGVFDAVVMARLKPCPFEG
jgi:hypothetical protein